MFKHFGGVINGTEAGSLGADKRAAVSHAFTGENAGEFIAETLILTVKITNLTGTYADIACGNIGVSSDMTEKLGHKALTEAHNLSIRFALRIKVRAALAAAHRKRCERIFKGLLKAQELNNAFIYRRMETKAALIRTDCRVKLNTEASVYLNIAVIINPRYAELYNSFRFNHTVNHAELFILGMCVYNRFDRFQNFLYGLVEFLFAGITLNNGFVNLC